MSFVRPRAWLSRFRQLRKKHVLMSLGAVILCAGLVSVVAVSTVHAQGAPSWVGVQLATMLAWIFLQLGSILGSVVTLLISVLLSVVKYNGFINALPVQIGWVVMRDIANLFFIVILLVIAFGTILGLEKYNYRALLKDFIVMAIAVNFSRTIVGFIIDISQVIMLTFVNGFAAAAAGNFINALRLNSLYAFNTNVQTGVSNALEAGRDPGVSALGFAVSTLGAIFLGFLITIVVFITVLAFVAVLMYRIVMLWVVTIFAPLAFFLKTFPQGEKYYAEWWDKLKSAAQAGPILAFFLWLALVISAQTNDVLNLGTVSNDSALPSIEIFGSAIGTTDSLISLLITLAILFMGLESVQKLGDGFGGIAGWASGTSKKWISNFTKKPASFLAKGAAQTVDEWSGALTGIKLSESRFNIPYTYTKWRKGVTDDLKKKEDEIKKKEDEVKGRKDYEKAAEAYGNAKQSGDAEQIGKARIALEEKKAAYQKALKAGREEYDVVGKEEDKRRVEEAHAKTLAMGAKRARERQEAISTANASNTQALNNAARGVGQLGNENTVAGQDGAETRTNLATVYSGLPQGQEVLARYERDLAQRSNEMLERSPLGARIRSGAQGLGGNTLDNQIQASGDLANQFEAEMQGARADIIAVRNAATPAQQNEIDRSTLQVIGENLADSLQGVVGSMGYESTRDGARNFLADKLTTGDFDVSQISSSLQADLNNIKTVYDAAVAAAWGDDAALARARKMRDESVLNSVAQERKGNPNFDMNALRIGRNLNNEQRGQLNQGLRRFNDRDATMRDNGMYYRYARNVNGVDTRGNQVNLADLANAQQDRMNNRDAANKIVEDLSGLHATVANQIHQEVKSSVHYSNEINITAQADKEREYREAAAKAVQGSLDYDVLLNKMRDDKKSSDAVLLAKINKTLGGFNLSLGELQQALRDKEKFKEIFDRITKDSGAPEDVKGAKEDAVRNALSYMAQSLQ